MKTKAINTQAILLMILILLCATITMNAQTEGWEETGTNTATTNTVSVGTTDDFAKLNVNGADGAASSTTVLNGVLNLSAVSDVLLSIGGVRTGTNYIWMQSRDFESATMRALSLNPNGGNVGIGITAPSEKLHVVGDYFLDGAMGIGLAPSVSSQIILQSVVLATFPKFINQISVIQNVTTGTSIGYNSQFTTEANAVFGSHRHLELKNVVLGAGSTIDIQEGMLIHDLTSATTNYGIRCLVSNAANRWGLYFAGTADNYLRGDLGIATATPSATLDVNGTTELNGQVTVNGSGTFTGTWTNSDERFKTNIDTISDAISIIQQMHPKTFYFDTTNVYGLNFSSQKQYGLISQEVETVLPELILETNKVADYDTLGNIISEPIVYKSLNYTAFIAILMKGMQEQQDSINNLSIKTTHQDSVINNLERRTNRLKNKTVNQDSLIDNLQLQINRLANVINGCCSNNNRNTTSLEGSDAIEGVNPNYTDVALKDAQTVVLEQNAPNPFAEQTAISYFLSDNFSKAQMLFYDAQGRLVQTSNLTEAGAGVLNVFASDLTSGVYTYTLVVDGEIVESKKMVKQ